MKQPPGFCSVSELWTFYFHLSPFRWCCYFILPYIFYLLYSQMEVRKCSIKTKEGEKKMEKNSILIMRFIDKENLLFCDYVVVLVCASSFANNNKPAKYHFCCASCWPFDEIWISSHNNEKKKIKIFCMIQLIFIIWMYGVFSDK